MPTSLRHTIHLLVILCVFANGLAWAGHVDMPVAPGDDSEVSAAHGHAHDSQGADVADSCDHCCHAGAHMLAVPSGTDALAVAIAESGIGYLAVAPLVAAPNPPYIPPIA